MTTERGALFGVVASVVGTEVGKEGLGVKFLVWMIVVAASLKSGAEVKLAEKRDIIYSYSVSQNANKYLQANDFIKNVVPQIMKTFQVDL